jgi:hypothetical protein
MIHNRFSETMPEEAGQPSALQNSFFLVPVPANHMAMPLLPWLYQQLYQQATQINQQPKLRDLFAVMN